MGIEEYVMEGINTSKVDGKVAKKMSDFYKLKGNSKILDIGCGKGYLLYDFLKILPNATVRE